MELNEILEQRKEKLTALLAKGLKLYPSISSSRQEIASVLKDFKEGKRINLCGRIMAKRQHGKVTFLDLKDATAKIQLYLQDETLDEESLIFFKAMDIADIVQVEGELFKTRTAEPTVKVEKFFILAKALRPLPEKWHGLKDIDLRYRQRYLDLITNEEVKKVFLMRTQIIKAIRKFLDEKGFLEVETPMMHYLPGGAVGRPFKTYHNEYALDLYLRIAPELYLKELLVGGLDKVYEINRSFRNEGISSRHNPEFTMLEVYWAYADYQDMMHLCEDLIIFLAKEVLGKTNFEYQGKTIDLQSPWQRLSFAKMVEEKFSILPTDNPEVMLKKLQAKGFAHESQRLSRSQITKLIEEILSQQMSNQPTFVIDYFTNLCPLAKAKQENPALSERFELYIAGLEIANAYSELNDPEEQRRRFQEEIKELAQEEKKQIDEDYILALEYGLPPAGGLGIGIDRLVMLLSNQASIRDVILFPLLRPQK